MYLTFAEYQAYGGTLDETTFNNLEFEAEALVNWYTFNRLKNDTTFPVELKRLMYYLINLALMKNNLLNESGGEESSTGGVGKTIASQSNDGVSISYNVLSAHDLMESIKADSETAIQKYLQGVMNEMGHKLLYRGVYPDE